MNLIRRALFETNYQNDKFYILLVSNFDDGLTKGYMPIGRNIGFVATTSYGTLGRTIAHELRHGAFTLKHIYEEYPTIAPFSTSNLMDKGIEVNLVKPQWDRIHNPVSTQPVFNTFNQGSTVMDEFELWVSDFTSPSSLEMASGCPTIHQKGIKILGSYEYIEKVKRTILYMASRSKAGYNLFLRAAQPAGVFLVIAQARQDIDPSYKIYPSTSVEPPQYGAIPFNFVQGFEPLPRGQGLKSRELGIPFLYLDMKWLIIKMMN